jgi:hypothetical protein
MYSPEVHNKVVISYFVTEHGRSTTNVEIGQNVLIPIPNVDRGKGDPRNVMAVVGERVHNGYKLGTSSGMLLGSYTRNQFELPDSQSKMPELIYQHNFNAIDRLY